jgi:hypothetical protein
MKIIISAVIIIIVLSSSLFAQEDVSEKPTFQGQIFVSLGEGPLVSTVSFPQQITYLFKVDGAEPRVIKLVNKFILKKSLPMEEELLLKAPILGINALRAESCDETYESFLEYARQVSEEKRKRKYKEPFDTIIYYEKVSKVTLPNNYLLQCYVMYNKDYKIIKK